MKHSTNERRFDRGAWLHLILPLALLLFAVASLVYRFQLPTDGWRVVEPEGFDSVGYLYLANIMGAPSGLQPGDHLIAVGGISLANTSSTAFWPLNDSWQAGNTMRYTVERGDQVVDIEVPLVHWDVVTYWRGLDRSMAEVLTYVGMFLFLAVAILVFWRSPDNPAARALWVLAAALLIAFFTLDLLPQTIADNFVNPAASISLAFLIGLTFTILLPPAFIRFALVFPRPSALLVSHPWLALVPYAIGLLVVVAFFLQLFAVGWYWTAASVFIALLILIYNALVSRDAVSRAQLRWGLGGMIVGLLFLFLPAFANLFVVIPASVQPVLDSLGALSLGIMGITLGIAVMRYRLFDIDVIIRRTTSYAILTGLLLLVYFGSVVILQRLLAPITGESTVAVVFSTLLIAALFLPLRRRIQQAIDKRFFRQKYDAEQVMAQFAATVRDETDLDALTAELARVIQETMQPEFVSVWLSPVATERTRADESGPVAQGHESQVTSI